MFSSKQWITARKKTSNCQIMIVLFHVIIAGTTMALEHPSDGPKYTNFVKTPKGQVCVKEESLELITESSLVSCGLECIDNVNCTGFNLDSASRECDLRRAVCEDNRSLTQTDQTSEYYVSQELCPRAFVRLFTDGTTTISSRCATVWQMFVSGPEECQLRACQHQANAINYYLPENGCVAKSCSEQILYVKHNYREDHYEVYGFYDYPVVTTSGGKG